jgi:hypothetical protein
MSGNIWRKTNKWNTTKINIKTNNRKQKVITDLSQRFTNNTECKYPG